VPIPRCLGCLDYAWPNRGGQAESPCEESVAVGRAPREPAGRCHTVLSKPGRLFSCPDSGTVVLGFFWSGRWPLALLESLGLGDDNDEHDHQGSGRDQCGLLMNEPGA